LGAIVLQEPIDWLLIFCGIAIVNLRVFNQISFGRPVPLANEEVSG
jgi:hypothetical protein